MKFHIIKDNEDLQSIAKTYDVSYDDLVDVNFNDVFTLGKKIKIPQKRDKSITKNIEDIYLKDKETTTLKDEKYICPYCKNIILIPPKK